MSRTQTQLDAPNEAQFVYMLRRDYIKTGSTNPERGSTPSRLQQPHSRFFASTAPFEVSFWSPRCSLFVPDTAQILKRGSWFECQSWSLPSLDGLAYPKRRRITTTTTKQFYPEFASFFALFTLCIYWFYILQTPTCEAVKIDCRRVPLRSRMSLRHSSSTCRATMAAPLLITGFLG